MKLAVDCKHLKKTFGTGTSQTLALQGVDFTVKEEELVLIVGPSGSGKTTLLSIIGGILRPDEGEVNIYDHPLTKLSTPENDLYRKKNIGFIFQSFNLIPTLTAEENVSIPLLLNDIPESEAIEEAQDILNTLGLGDKTHRFPKQLSTGEQQRVSIARGAIIKPPLILCDEPTSYLDAETGKSVMEHLKKIQQEKKCAVVVVTHDPRIFDYADRIEKIEDGYITHLK
jgi:putative ABC transport system ATP-binding protein